MQEMAYLKESQKVCTRVDLSDKMQSATSFGSHELLSFEGKKCEFGGPICNRKNYGCYHVYSNLFFRVSTDVFPIQIIKPHNNLHRKWNI